MLYVTVDICFVSIFTKFRKGIQPLETLL